MNLGSQRISSFTAFNGRLVHTDDNK